ncbi:Homeobox protein knotted-1-like [Seminavis robusta]|uniref:Homeobox protein knotted-1-like n=1 Tax=Seminavis robusta TaxID=568900 RepID=A0A9N8HTV9_9STRA|nr:Homeobox protein knotted-1-like [Seminavis robusta]|eukprot:Sro1321_g262540.1 Homeobox protein knotted-1-like (1197) ;mRNA; f:27297-30887
MTAAAAAGENDLVLNSPESPSVSGLYRQLIQSHCESYHPINDKSNDMDKDKPNQEQTDFIQDKIVTAMTNQGSKFWMWKQQQQQQNSLLVLLDPNQNPSHKSHILARIHSDLVLTYNRLKCKLNQKQIVPSHCLPSEKDVVLGEGKALYEPTFYQTLMDNHQKTYHLITNASLWNTRLKYIQTHIIQPIQSKQGRFWLKKENSSSTPTSSCWELLHPNKPTHQKLIFYSIHRGFTDRQHDITTNDNNDSIAFAAIVSPDKHLPPTHNDNDIADNTVSASSVTLQTTPQSQPDYDELDALDLDAFEGAEVEDYMNMTFDMDEAATAVDGTVAEEPDFNIGDPNSHPWMMQGTETAHSNDNTNCVTPEATVHSNNNNTKTTTSTRRKSARKPKPTRRASEASTAARKSKRTSRRASASASASAYDEQSLDTEHEDELYTVPSRTAEKRKPLPPSTIEYLKAWMMSPQHIDHPYPTEQEKEKIMADTGIETKQLTNWFTNNRKRYWKPATGAADNQAKVSPTNTPKRGKELPALTPIRGKQLPPPPPVLGPTRASTRRASASKKKLTVTKSSSVAAAAATKKAAGTRGRGKQLANISQVPSHAPSSAGPVRTHIMSREIITERAMAPNKMDAVFGRGRKKDNVRNGSLYRSLIEAYWLPYSRLDTSDIARRRAYVREKILDVILNNNGRFIMRDGPDMMRQLDPNDSTDIKQIFKKVQRSLFNEKKRQEDMGTPMNVDVDTNFDPTPDFAFSSKQRDGEVLSAEEENEVSVPEADAHVTEPTHGVVASGVDQIDFSEEAAFGDGAGLTETVDMDFDMAEEATAEFALVRMDVVERQDAAEDIKTLPEAIAGREVLGTILEVPPAPATEGGSRVVGSELTGDTGSDAEDDFQAMPGSLVHAASEDSEPTSVDDLGGSSQDAPHPGTVAHSSSPKELGRTECESLERNFPPRSQESSTHDSAVESFGDADAGGDVAEAAAAHEVNLSQKGKLCQDGNIRQRKRAHDDVACDQESPRKLQKSSSGDGREERVYACSGQGSEQRKHHTKQVELLSSDLTAAQKEIAWLRSELLRSRKHNTTNEANAARMGAELERLQVEMRKVEQTNAALQVALSNQEERSVELENDLMDEQDRNTQRLVEHQTDMERERKAQLQQHQADLRQLRGRIAALEADLKLEREKSARPIQQHGVALQAEVATSALC